MIVLHAHWQPLAGPEPIGALNFWGENGATVLPADKIDRRKRAARSHPFALTHAQLASELAVLTGIEPTARRDGIVLRLPTGRFGPQPSPQLLHEWEPDNDDLRLLRWRVPVLRMMPTDGYMLLEKLPAPEDLPGHIRLGDDVHFWQTAAQLALETIAQQKLMPDLIAEPKSDQSGAQRFYVRWRPVLDGPRDGARVGRLRTAMPPVCRAAEAGEKGELPPRFLLDSFLTGVVDGLVRRWQDIETISRSLDDTAGHFVRALISRQSAKLDIAPAQGTQIAVGYRAWLRNLHAAGDAYFRVALRLSEPPVRGGSASWTLHYLLQARDDPSLLIDADQLWRGEAQRLGRPLENPQEVLLTGLGFAARQSEAIRRSLQAKRPVAAQLSADEAYAYLRDAAPLLEESGFGVLVPPWWNKPNARLGVRLHMRGQSSERDGAAVGLLSMEKLVRYDWRLSLAGEELSWEEFQSLVAIKSPLVQVRGQWVQLDPEQIEAAIRFWQRQETDREIGLLEAASLALDGAVVDGLTVEGVDAGGWLRNWLDRFTGKEALEVLDAPDGLEATLRPYQQYGYSWLDFQRRWGIGACLADDMGLGKTIQTLAMLQQTKDLTGQLPGPTLLVAPTSVVLNWAKEAARFTPDLRVLVHQGATRLRADVFVAEARQHDLVATSYALVRRDEAALEQVDWFGVILDEAQNIKNPQTKQARIIRKLDAGFRLALTGTPVENRLGELWSIMHFLNPGFLGSRERFRKEFAVPIERYSEEAAVERLRRVVAPFILRRVKTDPTVIQDLPEKQESKEYCYLSTEQATLYEAVVQDALQTIEQAESDMARKGLVLSMLMKLKQVCNHPGHFLHQLEGAVADEQGDGRSGKLSRLSEMVDELLNSGDRALIFSQFTEMGAYLQRYLQERFGHPVLFLHGGVPARRRQDMVERFQENGDGPPIFVLSLKAGGTGLNLTRASHVFHFDRWWNPAVEDQATDRAFRIGQRQNVQVHKFVCVGTLEEKIDAMIEAKKALAASVVGSGENWLTELSTDDLRELVHLRRQELLA